MKKRILALLLMLCLLGGNTVYAAEGDFSENAEWDQEITEEAGETDVSGLDEMPIADESDRDFDGAGLLVYDLTGERMIYGKNLDGIREPASVTKVMTCLLALEYGGLSDWVEVKQSVLNALDPVSSVAGIEAGEYYTLEQLLYGLMVQSGNDAAVVIADYLGGSVDAFVAMMNEKAAALGCANTHFTNPHGLHDEDHYSTARDLAKIMTAAMEYDIFWTLCATERYVIPETEYNKERVLISTNYLISTEETERYYDSRVIGGKTGFTTSAGRCVACVADIGETKYLVVVLGASNTDENGDRIYGSFLTATAVLDYIQWEMAEVDLTGFVEAATENLSAVTKDAKQIAQLRVQDGAYAMLPAEYQEQKLSTVLNLEVPVSDETEIGDRVGYIEMYYGQHLLGTIEVYLTELRENPAERWKTSAPLPGYRRYQRIGARERRMSL